MKGRKFSFLGVLFILVLLGTTLISANPVTGATINVMPDWKNIKFALFNPADLSSKEFYPEIDAYGSWVEVQAGSTAEDQHIEGSSWADLTATASEAGTSSKAYTIKNGTSGVSIIVGGTEGTSESEAGFRFEIYEINDPMILFARIPVTIKYSIDALITEADDTAQAFVGLWNPNQKIDNSTSFDLTGTGVKNDTVTLTINIENRDKVWLYSGAIIETAANPVPAPSAFFLCGSGLLGLLILNRKRG